MTLHNDKLILIKSIPYMVEDKWVTKGIVGIVFFGVGRPERAASAVEALACLKKI